MGIECAFGLRVHVKHLCFQPFFFFFLAAQFDFSTTQVYPVYYSQDLQTSLFSNFFIKNGFHSTIYIFKNYFATMFSVFSYI